MEPSASTGGVRLPLHQQTTRIDRILEFANRLLATLFNLKDKAGRPYSHIPPGAEAFLPSSDFIASQKRKAAVDFESTIQVAIRELDRLKSFIPDPMGSPPLRALETQRASIAFFLEKTVAQIEGRKWPPRQYEVL